MEILTYSVQQLNVEADRSEKWDNDATISLIFYNGVQFTDRRTKDGEQSPFEDAEVVFEGEIDESKITYKDESMYDVYTSTRTELQERNEPEDDGMSAEREDDIRNPPVSLEEKMLTINRYYGPPTYEG